MFVCSAGSIRSAHYRSVCYPQHNASNPSHCPAPRHYHSHVSCSAPAVSLQRRCLSQHRATYCPTECITRKLTRQMAASFCQLPNTFVHSITIQRTVQTAVLRVLTARRFIITPTFRNSYVRPDVKFFKQRKRVDHPEQGKSVMLRNVGANLRNNTASQPTRLSCELTEMFQNVCLKSAG
jgi:hypothetical protein